METATERPRERVQTRNICHGPYCLTRVLEETCDPWPRNGRAIEGSRARWRGRPRVVSRNALVAPFRTRKVGARGYLIHALFPAAVGNKRLSRLHARRSFGASPLGPAAPFAAAVSLHHGWPSRVRGRGTRTCMHGGPCATSSAPDHGSFPALPPDLSLDLLSPSTGRRWFL